MEIYHTTNAVPSMHVLKSGVDLGKRLAVSDELVDLELTIHIVRDQVW